MVEKYRKEIRVASLSRCGGKTRTQIRPHTVLEDFPLFCPKCKYTCVIYFRNKKLKKLKRQTLRRRARPDR